MTPKRMKLSKEHFKPVQRTGFWLILIDNSWKNRKWILIMSLKWIIQFDIEIFKLILNTIVVKAYFRSVFFLREQNVFSLMWITAGIPVTSI